MNLDFNECKSWITRVSGADHPSVLRHLEEAEKCLAKGEDKEAFRMLFQSEWLAGALHGRVVERRFIKSSIDAGYRSIEECIGETDWQKMCDRAREDLKDRTEKKW